MLVSGGGGATEFTAGGLYLLGEVSPFITYSSNPMLIKSPSYSVVYLVYDL